MLDSSGLPAEPLGSLLLSQYQDCRTVTLTSGITGIAWYKAQDGKSRQIVEHWREKHILLCSGISRHVISGYVPVLLVLCCLWVTLSECPCVNPSSTCMIGFLLFCSVPALLFHLEVSLICATYH